ncbi:MAG: glycosyltransferase, partial [Luteolibacter sp.]
MRILHTVASLRSETGGPARSVPGLANALVDLGLDVHVWSPDVPEHLPTAVRFVLHRGSLEDALDEIADLDLIHDHGLWLSMNHRVAMVAKEKNIPRMVSPRGMLEPWALNHKKWKKRLGWWLYQRRDLGLARALHATAASEAEQFERLGLKNPIQIIPNGVDLPSSSAQRTPSTGPKTALFLSRIHPKKGLPLLVDAWAKVMPVGWQMQIVGPDENDHRAEIEVLVQRAGLSAQWHFSGALEGEEKRRAFEQADLFILPTYSENFGIAVAEALVYGVPVITTTGTPWEGLIEHECGWWVKPDSVALANALESACRLEPEQLKVMGERGITWMRNDFTWGAVATQMTVASPNASMAAKRR